MNQRLSPMHLNAQPFRLRAATMADVPVLEKLIPLSVRSLQALDYSPAQMEAALGPVFGVDKALIRDGTYWVVECADQIIGCGGWSRRNAVYGGDHARQQDDAILDPASDPARVRAFFVHPDWARRGVGTLILRTSETAIRDAGFKRILLVATLAGVPLYLRHGYTIESHEEAPLRSGLTLPVVRMSKVLP